jgi:hypothetical protein
MNRIRKITFVLISFTLVSCGITGNDSQPAATATEAEALPASPVPDDGVWTGEAVFIDDVRLHYDDPESGSAEVEIDGSFPDGCTELSEIVTTQEGSTFTIRLMTTRPMDAQCTMALVPFNINESLNLSDFANGEIVEVDVYGFKVEFTVGQIPQASGGGG